jgi:Aspartyl protease/PDZ domain
MGRSGWSSVLLSALVLAARPSQAEVPAAIYPISLIDNRIFVEARVDGSGPFAFILDTGSSSITLEAPLTRRLGLRPHGAGSTGGAGENTVDYSTIHLASFAFGTIELGPVDVPSLDNSALARAIGFRHFDGILGANLFRTRIVTIDTARARLMMQDPGRYRPSKTAIAVPIDFDENDMPIIDGMVNGVPGRFAVDTGDRSSLTLFGPFWRTHGLDQSIGPTVTSMTGYGVGGPIRSIVGRPSGFSIGDLTVPAPVTRLSLQKAGAFASADYAGSIGMGILKRFIVAFDYPHHKMWLEKNSSYAAADRYDRSGVWLGLDESDHVTALAVVEDGPAGAAGLKPGDIITAIGTIAARPETLFGIRALLMRPNVGQVEFHIVRDGVPVALTVALRDLISPPTG